MTEPTHLGADGRYNEDESRSPVHEKKQDGTPGTAHVEEAGTRFRRGVVEGGGRGGWIDEWRMAPWLLMEVSYVGLAHPRYHRRERKTTRARHHVENEQPPPPVQGGVS